jgi:hypothetical protein
MKKYTLPFMNENSSFVSHLIRYSINLSSHVDIYIKGGCYDALQSNLIYVIASEIMWSAIFTG